MADIDLRAAALLADDGWPQPLDLVALAATDPQPPPFIAADWLPAGYATLMAGHGGVGKSGIALHLSVCMAAGIDFFGLAVERRKVAYLSCEDREGVLHWRLNRICRYENQDLAALSGSLAVLALVGHENLLYGDRDPQTGGRYTASYAKLERRMIDFGAEVLVVDGVADVYGGNENSRAEVKGFINALVRLIDPDRGAVILLHHTNKLTGNGAAADGYSGSTAWHNSVRARWHLFAEPTGGATKFERRAREQEERDAIMAAVREVVDAADYVPAASTGPRTAYHVLKAVPSFPDSLAGTPGRKRFWRHIEALRRMGDLRESSIRRADRKRTATLVPGAASELGCANAANESEEPLPNTPLDATAAMRRMPQGGMGGRARTPDPCPGCRGEGCGWCSRGAS